MAENVLSAYRPQAFFSWFEKISAIPRGSGKEQAIGEFLLRFARDRGFFAAGDAIGNIFMRVPASPGYEAEPVILLQAHLDMVWAKDPAVEFDFAAEPIRFRIQNGCLYGAGTSLGADNGVGIAFILAVADDTSLQHPGLECLFTVQEEVGLVGIRNFDLSQITARRMVNTDCGFSHGMCVSSAGKEDYIVRRVFDRRPVQGWAALELLVENGLGGHGGLMIHKGRACAVNVAGELLHLLKRDMPVRLVSFDAPGGAIHPRSRCVLAVPAGAEARAAAQLLAGWEKLSGRYARSDPGVTVSVAAARAESALSAEDSGKLIDLLYLIPTAALRHDGENTDFIVTSNGIGETCLAEDGFTMRGRVRSALNCERDSVLEKLITVADLLGFAVEKAGGYDSWPPRSDSVLQRKLREAHRSLFGAEIEEEHIHGGIEVSCVMERYPDMDAVGISPTAEGCHTPDEHLYLDAVQPFWDLMVRFLAMKDADMGGHEVQQ